MYSRVAQPKAEHDGEWMQMVNPKTFEPLMDNAMRLVEDAVLLRDNQRYASASVLGVIALEEVGKLAHDVWKTLGIEPTTTRRNWHLRKQSAACSLVLARAIAPDIVGLLDAGRGDDEEAIATMAARVSGLGAARRLAGAERGLLDKAKKTGLYQDAPEDQIDRSRLSRADVDELIAQVADAVGALRSTQTVVVGRVIYDVVKDRL